MSQVEPGSAPSSKLRILLVIKCLGFGGAERLLVDTVARGDRHSFEYEVAYVLAAEHALVPDIASTGTPVHGLKDAETPTSGGRASPSADRRWPV